MFEINLHEPDFTIDCSTLVSSSNIYKTFRDHGVKSAYVYTLLYKPTVFSYEFLKVGLSAPTLGEDREYQVGERVARQLSHVPGWDSEPASSHGSDFYYGIRKLAAKGKVPNLTKNDILIGIWDTDKRMQLHNIEESSLEVATWAEGELAYQHKSLYKRLPRLNHRNPANTKIYRKQNNLTTLKNFMKFE